MELDLPQSNGPVIARLTEEDRLVPDCFDEAVDCVRRGGILLAPTDTLYGLFADATSPDAVKRVVDIKGRPDGQPIPVAVPDLEMVAEVANMDACPVASELMRAFWPGALTIVLPAAAGVSRLIAPQSTVGVRAPDHVFLLRVLRAVGRPLTATSANLSGDAQPDELNRIAGRVIESADYIVDQGVLKAPVPSTVIDVTQFVPKIVRHGAVSQEDIDRVLGKELE
ncbi:MAG: threonylcarbamoyl-AMP synthase [Armatimonadetes bacterium]|nr:threonylcarbamoyl-AMP synthase [Armatimonadota bacterium]